MNKPADASVKSAARALDLLELLARRGAPMSHADIAAALAIPKSSLSGLLRTLAGRGYIVSEADGRSYGLGPAVVALAARSARSFELARTARPVLGALCRAVNESAALNLRRGDEIEVVASVNSSLPLLYAMKVGDRAPLYATSGGKVLLAALPEAEREAYLARIRLAGFTPRTIADTATLRDEIARVAATGLATSREEYTPGIVGVAVPVRDRAGAVIAALNLAIPSVRCDAGHQRAAEAALRRAAAQLAAAIASTFDEPAAGERRARAV